MDSLPEEGVFWAYMGKVELHRGFECGILSAVCFYLEGKPGPGLPGWNL